MTWQRDWDFCQKTGCLDRSPTSAWTDRDSAVQWLQPCKKDIFKMLAMRALLLQRHSAWQISAMSEEAILTLMAELLVSGQVHTHTHPAQETPAYGYTPVESLKPFPMSERRGRAEAGSGPPASDPSTFPSNLDPAAQANALAAAAASGKPFCVE